MKKKVTGTVYETIIVKKEVEVEVEIYDGEEEDSPEVDERIDSAIREAAYAETIMDFQDQHGWEGIGCLVVNVYREDI